MAEKKKNFYLIMFLRKNQILYNLIEKKELINNQGEFKVQLKLY